MENKNITNATKTLTESEKAMIINATGTCDNCPCKGTAIHTEGCQTVLGLPPCFYKSVAEMLNRHSENNAATTNTATPVPHNSPINLMHYIKSLHEKHNRTMGEHETTFYTLWENKLNTIYNTVPHECSFVRELTDKEIELLATAGITREDICIAVNEMLTTNTNHYYYWLTWKRNYQLFEMGDIDTMVSDCAMEKFIEITYDAMMSICRPLTTYEKTLLSKFNINNQAIVDAICAVRGGEPFDEVVHTIFRDIMWYEMRGYITSYQTEQACNIIINLIEDGLKTQPIQRKPEKVYSPVEIDKMVARIAELEEKVKAFPVESMLSSLPFLGYAADAKPDTDKHEFLKEYETALRFIIDASILLSQHNNIAKPDEDAKPEKKSCDVEGLRKLSITANGCDTVTVKEAEPKPDKMFDKLVDMGLKPEKNNDGSMTIYFSENEPTIPEAVSTAILVSDTFDTSNMNTLVEKLRSIALQVAVITGLPYENTLQAVADIAVELVEG